jgi:competence protein ComGC
MKTNIAKTAEKRFFTVIEVFVACIIAAILMSMLVPALYRSIQWAKFNRWYAYNRGLSNDPDCIVNFNFQEGTGDILNNTASGADVQNHQTDKYQGYLSNKNGGAHNFQWVKSGGRWGRFSYKNALQFNGADTYVLIPGTQGLDFTPTDDFTVLCWVKFDTFTLGKCPYSKSLWGTAEDAAAQYDLYANPWSGSFGQGSFDVDVFTTCATWTNSDVDFEQKGWTHLALRYRHTGTDAITGNALGQITVFVNAQPLGPYIDTTGENPNTAAATGWQASSASGLNVPLLLGGAGCYRKYWSPGTYDPQQPGVLSNELLVNFIFSGKMDEFVLYKRAWSDGDIRGHYEMGKE